MEEHVYDDLDPVPICILLNFAIPLCAYFSWLGFVATRLYFFTKAPSPEPKRFLILPAYRRDHSPQRDHQRHATAFPAPVPPKIPQCKLASQSRVPRVKLAGVDANDLPDPEICAFLAELQRIPRLSAFVKNNCGDGSDFPDVLFAMTPVKAEKNSLALPGLNSRPTVKHKSMEFRMVGQKEWFTIDNTYKNLHETRDSLLTKKNAECIQANGDGEAACEELLQKVVKYLVSKYPDKFSINTVNRYKHVRNEVTREEWSLVLPFNCHPLEVCARPAMEDFNILLKGESTQLYYL